MTGGAPVHSITMSGASFVSVVEIAGVVRAAELLHQCGLGTALVAIVDMHLAAALHADAARRAGRSGRHR